MGYEVANFVGDIDEEYVCAICTKVVENPAETPCQHVFCSECIKEWVAVDPKCPVDSEAVLLVDLRPTPKYFRNLLGSLEIRCEFQSSGCQATIPLEQLQNHLTSCIYKPDAAVVCDKGCKTVMTRHEYEKSCIEHVTTKFNGQLEQVREELREQRDEIKEQLGHQIRDEIKEQIDDQMREEIKEQLVGQIRNEIKEQIDDQMREEIKEQLVEQIRDDIKEQIEDQMREEIKEQLVEEIRDEIKEQIDDQMREEIKEQLVEQIRDDIKEQIEDQMREEIKEQLVVQIREEIKEQLEDQIRIEIKKQLEDQMREDIREQLNAWQNRPEEEWQWPSGYKLPNWRSSNNMKISTGTPTALKPMTSERFRWAYAQFDRRLTSALPYFRIRISRIGVAECVAIGLTQIDDQYELLGRKIGSIGYYDKGEIIVNGKDFKGLPKLNSNDLIECGLIYPKSFQNTPTCEVYFTVNFELVFQIIMEIPIEGFFPTIRMTSCTTSDSQVEYLFN